MIARMLTQQRQLMTVFAIPILCLAGTLAVTTTQGSAGKAEPPTHSPDPRFRVGERLFSDDFASPTLQGWVAELQSGGTVAGREGKLVIDVPAGCTIWLKS